MADGDDTNYQRSGTILRSERRVPTKRDRGPYIPITPEMRDELNAEFERTGANLAILCFTLSNEEHKITTNVVSAWRRGRIKKARKIYWSRVMDRLQSMPEQLAPNVFAEPPGFATAKIIAKRTLRDTLFRLIPGKTSDALNKNELLGKVIVPDVIDARLPKQKPWTTSPTLNTRQNSYPDLYRTIDKETYERLHLEVRRTRISPRTLLVIFDSAPTGLNAQRIGEWLRLVTRSAEHEYLDWVLAAYALLPDAEVLN